MTATRFRGPFAARVWREFLYLWIVLLLTPFGFAYAAITVGLGVGLVVTIFGLVVLALLVIGARGWGGLHRGLARTLLHTTIDDPTPRQRGRGIVAFTRHGLTDVTGGRALAFLAGSFPLSVLGGLVSVSFFFIGLGGLSHVIWGRYLTQTIDGVVHHGARLGPHLFIDTAPRQWAAAGVGLVFLFVLWPLTTQGFAWVHARLAVALLGPTATQHRIHQLELTRQASVEDADQRLRRLERDLHDGTQAQLATVALKLGDAVDRMRQGQNSDPATVDLLRSAHDLTRRTLAGVREVARGAHPVDIDRGLEPALRTLAGSLPVPVHLDLHLPDRLPAAIESIAYYCTMELVANALKHAAPTMLRIAADHSLDAHGLDALAVVVTDDGPGGAVIGPLGGLHGIVERLAPVDGVLALDSPVGGPTTARIRIPLTTAAGMP